jgi:hypothetical protein
MTLKNNKFAWFVRCFIILLVLLTIAIRCGVVHADTPSVTSPAPKTTVTGISSPVLDIQGKIQLELINPVPAKVNGCKKVKSFAKRGRKTCIILPTGTKYKIQAQDRSQFAHIVTNKTKKGYQRFYKGKDNMWRTVWSNSLAFAGVSEYQPSQYILYPSFPVSTFDVKVSYEVVKILQAMSSTDGCNTTQTTSGHGEATDTTSVTVTAKYTGEAKSQAIQLLPQSFKDSVDLKAANDAKQHQQTGTTLKECVGPPVDTYTNIPVNITNGPLDVHVNGTIYIYAMVKTMPNVTFDFDQPGLGYIGPKELSSTFDNQPCLTGYTCYKALYKAPSTPGDDYVSAYAGSDDGNAMGGDYVFVNVLDDNFGG